MKTRLRCPARLKRNESIKRMLTAFAISVAIVACSGRSSESEVLGVADVAIIGDAPVTESAASYGYLVRLVDSRWPDKPFFFKIAKENQPGIRSFEAYLIDDLVPVHPTYGRQLGVMMSQVEVLSESNRPHPNHSWKFVVDPNTVKFADWTTEVCDSSIAGVEEHLKLFMASRFGWCPWHMPAIYDSHVKTFE